jgi:DNA-binding HxlR family transcriptional regulator
MQKVVVTKLSVQKWSQEAAMPVSKKEISPCPIDAMLSVIDGRWKGTILWRLLDDPMRTNELRRSIPEITERMLIRHLQDLVQDGILERHEEKRVPPCVRYSISEYGMTMVPVLEAICAWGRRHLETRVAPCAKNPPTPRTPPSRRLTA